MMGPVIPPKDVMTLQEASAYLAMDEAALRALAEARRVPCLAADGGWLFSRKSLDKWRTLRARAGS
jgi:hypothetical protein